MPIFDCNSTTCIQGIDSFNRGADELHFNGKFLAKFEEENIIDAFVKCHKRNDKLRSEIAIMQTFRLNINVLSFLNTPDGRPLHIIGTPLDSLYHVAVYEAAQWGYQDLLPLCFKGTGNRDPWMFNVRRISQGVIEGFKYLHNQRITHGNVDEASIRFARNRSDNRITIKVTNFGEAKKHAVELSDNVFKLEVQQVGQLLRYLLFSKITPVSRSGCFQLFTDMTNAMVNPDLKQVPSLELVSTCLFLMDKPKAAGFMYQAAQSILGDIVCAKLTVETLKLHKSDGWQKELPPQMRNFIKRNGNNKLVKDQHRKDTGIMLSLNLGKLEMFGGGANLLFTMAKNAIDNNFRTSPKYDDNLLALIRFTRNIMSHKFDVEMGAALSADGYTPESFVHFLICRIMGFASEVETLLYTMKHDLLDTFKSYNGNRQFIAEGGGSLFSREVQLQRAQRTDESYNQLKDEIRASIERAVHHPTFWTEEEVAEALACLVPSVVEASTASAGELAANISNEDW